MGRPIELLVYISYWNYAYMQNGHKKDMTLTQNPVLFIFGIFETLLYL